MKIALTGITGFVGQSLMPMLVRECPNIEILTLNMDVLEAEHLYSAPEYTQCKHIRTTELDKLVEFNPEITMHLATVTTARNDTEIIKPMVAANIEFGVLLLDALTKCSNMKLFVNTGSFAEYRLGPGSFESAYLYTASKTAFRTFVDYYSKLAGFRYITAVPYSVYGGKMTAKRIMDYIRESMDSDIPVDMTAGEQVLDFIHVDDVAGFFTYVANHAQEFYRMDKNGEEFHLGTGRGTSLREVAAMMEEIVGKKCNINWGGRPYRDRDTMYAVAPIAKNLLLTGWRAKIGIREGISLMMKD